MAGKKNQHNAQAFMDRLNALTGNFYANSCSGKILFLNQALCKDTGIDSLEEYANLSILSDALPLDYPSMAIVLNNNHLVINQKRSCQFIEERLLNGKQRFYLSHKVPFYAPNGAIIGIYGYSLALPGMPETAPIQQAQHAMASDLPDLDDLSNPLYSMIECLSFITLPQGASDVG